MVRRDVAEVILSISGSIFVLLYDSSGSLWLVGNLDTSKQELPPQPLWMLCGTQPIWCLRFRLRKILSYLAIRINFCCLKPYYEQSCYLTICRETEPWVGIKKHALGLVFTVFPFHREKVRTRPSGWGKNKAGYQSTRKQRTGEAV